MEEQPDSSSSKKASEEIWDPPQYKDGLSKYGDCNYKDLYNGIFYAVKRTSLFWDYVLMAGFTTAAHSTPIFELVWQGDMCI